MPNPPGLSGEPINVSLYAMKRCINKQKMLCIIMITEHFYIFERNTGIEPASQAWEARALPMC